MSHSSPPQVGFTENDFHKNGILQKNVAYTFIGAMEKGNEELGAICISFMKRHLTRENCFQRLNLANEYDCEELIQSVNLYIVRRLTDLIKHPEFLELTTNQVNRLIKLEKKRVNSEGNKEKLNPSLLPGIVKWVKHIPNQREKHLFSLIKNLKLEAVDANILRQIFWNDESVRKNAECRSLYLEIIHKKYFEDSQFQVPKQVQTPPYRFPRVSGKKDHGIPVLDRSAGDGLSDQSDQSTVPDPSLINAEENDSQVINLNLGFISP